MDRQIGFTGDQTLGDQAAARNGAFAQPALRTVSPAPRTVTSTPPSPTSAATRVRCGPTAPSSTRGRPKRAGPGSKAGGMSVWV